MPIHGQIALRSVHRQTSNDWRGEDLICEAGSPCGWLQLGLYGVWGICYGTGPERSEQATSFPSYRLTQPDHGIFRPKNNRRTTTVVLSSHPSITAGFEAGHGSWSYPIYRREGLVRCLTGIDQLPTVTAHSLTNIPFKGRISEHSIF